ncbi:hypothetical protein OU995_22205 [Roseateles sp. SL47]|uniref:hypothetical protein n=1 Tax=Roseateles sp. SL47 TaxID=2995138 RepID=UPI00226EA99E|nr:hypothetical protein [Roseateles sp. SL47]WAC72246.1 hypothetical protein OU995_22205 [Roseateles sp. SL47]
MHNVRHFTLLAAAMLCSAAAFAACPEGGDQNRPKGPPPEAVAACKGKSAGATVTITLRDGKSVGAVCEQIGNVLAARPQGMGGRPPEGGRRDGDAEGRRGEGMPPPPDAAGSAPPPPPRCGNEASAPK